MFMMSVLKKPIFFICYLLTILLCTCSAASPLGAQNTISGNIRNLSHAQLQLSFEYDINRKESRLLSTIKVKENGDFYFKKDMVPGIYLLKADDQLWMLAIDKGQHLIIAADAKAGSIEIEGSEDTKKLFAYEKFRKESLNRLVTSVRIQIRALKSKGITESDPQMIALTKLETENYDRHRDELIQFIKNEMGTSIAIYPTSIRWGGEKNISFLVQLANLFERAHPNTKIAAMVNEKVKILKANSIGGKVADIKMPDKTGRIITLRSVKAKYILIDFWASWCVPCRRESQLLTELYQQYKSRGFEILGVSLDSEKKSWTEAIEKDKRTWLNVSSLQEFKTPASFDYAVTALPSNVLIDSAGKVIAKNLHDNELRLLIQTLIPTITSAR
jgi:thiol-disulfide isomerase/thioredoxin